ncbi:MAG: peptide ABC transporter substrate-binding protein [Pseudomonadota bacterium]|nr:peptide ABC transporter substrate-binding protein [Pseudomonadota bacterium]
MSRWPFHKRFDALQLRRCVPFVLVALSVLPHAQAAAPANTLRIGNGPEPETLDPHRTEGVSAGNIVRDLYEGLTAIGADGQAIPAAARRWSLSEDGLTYTFELHEALRWSNGEPLTAQDFVAGLQRSLTPATGSNVAQMLRQIRGAAAVIDGSAAPATLAVTAPDPQHVVITLDQPLPAFPGMLTHPSAFPVYGGAQASRVNARDDTLVSNGAYRLKRWVMQSHVELERNPSYREAARVAIEHVRYVTTEDIHSEYKRYRAGDLDVTYDIPLPQLKQIRSEYGEQLKIAPYLGLYFYGLNVTRAPLAAQADLRKALSMVIDREIIARKVLNGLALPAYSWIPPGTANSAAQQPEWAAWPYARRLDAARKLYEKAGYSANRPLQIQIRYNTHESHRRVATVVAAMWKQTLGLQTEFLNEEFKVFLHNRKQREKTQVYRAAWMADYNDPTSFLDILRSAHGKNDTGWSDPAYDAALDLAQQTVDPVQRAALLAHAEQRLFAETPAIPVYFYVSKHLVSPRVHGWTDNVLDYHYSRDLSLR